VALPQPLLIDRRGRASGCFAQDHRFALVNRSAVAPSGGGRVGARAFVSGSMDASDMLRLLGEEGGIRKHR
jgi:hypothetical protein